MSDDPGNDEGDDRPSKSARKRAAQAAQELGERLVRLPEAQLAALALPEALAEAIRAARSIASRAAAARQRQYIGKLMRSVELAPLQAALNAHSARAAERERALQTPGKLARATAGGRGAGARGAQALASTA